MTVTRKSESGFSLVELLVAIALGVLVVGAAIMIFSSAMQNSFLVTQRATMQQNARSAMNTMMHDLSIAGTGIPQGGIQLPTGAGSSLSKYGCYTSTCYIVNNTFPNNHLYSVLPNDSGGPVTVEQTDALTVVFTDSSLPINACTVSSINATGTSVTLGGCATAPPVGTPAYNDPAVGITVGDLIMLSNNNGTALGEVTNVAGGGVLTFANADSLNINQSGAASGNIAGLANPGGGGVYPPTTAVRILLVTYYINILPGPDGTKPTSGMDADDVPVLMKQISGHATLPVADSVEDLQVTYDLYDDGTGVAAANVPNVNYAATPPQSPNQIRDINVQLTSRTQGRATLSGNTMQRLTLSSSISPRNLSFKNRYN